MKKAFKRSLSLLVVVMLLISMMPMGVMAEAASQGTQVNATEGDFEYLVVEGGVSITGYTGPDGSLVIPGILAGKKVVAIGDKAFENFNLLTSITIPNGVISIGDYAFRYCVGLTSITIPNSVTTIGDYAFRFCEGLTAITLPSSLTAIGYGAFSWCEGLTSITIPTGVTDISDSAFSHCTKLTSIEIPGSVTRIGAEAFSNCWGLTSIELPNSVTSISNNAFYFCTGLTSIEIPNSVTLIDNLAFGHCQDLASITIPASVTAIGQGAFGGCEALNSITVDVNNKNYKLINEVLYNNEATTLILCPNGITSIEIPASVTTIDDYAFSNRTDLTNVAIPSSVTSIGVLAFSLCTGLTSIEIPNSVTNIGDRAFEHCGGLTSIKISNSLTDIGYAVFAYSYRLTSVTIPNSVTNIGEHAFDQCFGLTSIEIPNSVTSIGGYAFYGCSGLTSIEIPNSVTTIDYSAFAGCSELTSITIPDSVTTIGNGAFDGCEGLTIYGIEGSYAETYAIENDIPFSADAARILTAIVVTTAPDKTTYFVEESLDLTGIVVTATYSDGAEEAIDVTDANISGFDSSWPETDQVVTVTVEGKTATFTVSIEADEDAEKAKAVSDQIAALPGLSEITLGHKADVLTARMAYDQLSDSQKTLVTNLDTLADLEGKMEELLILTPPAKDENSGIEAIGLPSGAAIIVADEVKNVDKVKEAEEAAKAAGIASQKVISLNQIKPTMTEAELNVFNDDPESFVTLSIPLNADQLGLENYKIYHKKNDGSIEWITPTVSVDGKILIFKVSAFSSFGVLVKMADPYVPAEFDFIHKIDPASRNYSFIEFIDSPQIFDFVRIHYTEYLFVGEESKQYELSDVMAASEDNPEKDILDLLAELEPVVAKN